MVLHFLSRSLLLTSARRQGETGDLAVIVRKYTLNVHYVEDKLIEPESCQKVMNTLPVDTDHLVFGLRGVPDVQVVIPQESAAGKWVSIS